MIKYDPEGTGRVRDRILLDEDAQRGIVDSLRLQIAELNTDLKEAYDRGDIVQATAGLFITAEGPVLRFDITAIKNAFWKE